jgi:hypothetical protein
VQHRLVEQAFLVNATAVAATDGLPGRGVAACQHSCFGSLGGLLTQQEAEHVEFRGGGLEVWGLVFWRFGVRWFWCSLCLSALWQFCTATAVSRAAALVKGGWRCVAVWRSMCLECIVAVLALLLLLVRQLPWMKKGGVWRFVVVGAAASKFW